MRTTLTIEDDVAVRLERLRRSGRTLKDVVNQALRVGLDKLDEKPPPARCDYTMPMDLGEPLVDVTDVSEVLDMLDVEEWKRKLL